MWPSLFLIMQLNDIDIAFINSLFVYLFLSCKLSLSFLNSLCHSFSFFVTLSLSLFLSLSFSNSLCHSFSFLCHTLESFCHSLSCHTRFLTLSHSHHLLVTHFYLFVLSLCHSFYVFVTTSLFCHTLLYSLLSRSLSHAFSLLPINITSLSHISFLFMLALCRNFSFLCHTLFLFHSSSCSLFVIIAKSLFPIHIICLSHFSFFLVLSLCHIFYVFVTTSLCHTLLRSLFVTLPFSHFLSLFHSHYLFCHTFLSS
jgi:hypothetical protein